MNNLWLSGRAQRDLEEIRAYIADDLENPAAAAGTVRKILRDMRALRKHAMLGAPLRAAVTSGYRYLVTGKYLTFYRVQGTDVYIDRVLYGGRDYLRELLGDIQDQDLPEP